ncbi:MAG: hypothetical protein Q9209_003150 [Squamulea sp. 1 TL-2023]
MAEPENLVETSCDGPEPQHVLPVIVKSSESPIVDEIAIAAGRRLDSIHKGTETLPPSAPGNYETGITSTNAKRQVLERFAKPQWDEFSKKESSQEDKFGPNFTVMETSSMANNVTNQAIRAIDNDEESPHYCVEAGNNTKASNTHSPASGQLRSSSGLSPPSDTISGQMLSSGVDSPGDKHEKIPNERVQLALLGLDQIVDYVKLVEGRMQAIEERLLSQNQHSASSLFKPLLSESIPGPTFDLQVPQQLTLDIAYMKWPDFDAVDSKKHVINVLIGDPDHFNTPEQETVSRPRSGKYEDSLEKSKVRVQRQVGNAQGSEEYDMSDLPGHPRTAVQRSIMPERICINSDLLIKILNEITGLSLQGPLIILRPFKMLIHWEKKIRDRLDKLQKSCASKEEDSECYHKDTEKGQPATTGCVNDHLTAAMSERYLGYDKSESGPLRLSQQMQDNSSQEHLGATITDALGLPDAKVTSSDSNGDTIASKLAEKDTLTDNIESTDGRPALKRLRLLVRFMDTEVFTPLKKLTSQRRPLEVYFADLYHFYQPGDEVIARSSMSTNHEDIQVYRVLYCTGGRKYNNMKLSNRSDDTISFERGEESSPLVISCIHIGFNGKTLGPVTTTFSIGEYVGKRWTIELPLIPWAFSSLDNRSRLQERGAKFQNLARGSHKEYTGLTIDPREHIESQIMVDFDSTFQHRPDWKPVFAKHPPRAYNSRETETHDPTKAQYHSTKRLTLDCRRSETSYIHEDAPIDQLRTRSFIEKEPIFRQTYPALDELDEHNRVLLPGQVFGFVFRSRTWAAFNINLVDDPTPRPDGFGNLVLPDGHADLIKALVKTHSRKPRFTASHIDSEPRFDLVKGKGKGLIILCHGAPGVGKTSTAECIADATSRPLFPITCGDIGDTAAMIESNLAKNFDLAHRWGCVLLLDEADVFMQARSQGSGNDVQRNSMVSVFLRVLEYYSGILFLTTNRIGTFDPAFRSRIHISLYFPALDRKATMKVFNINLARLKADSNSYDVDEDDIHRWAENHFDSTEEYSRWNGRQIRNAFQTAVALAQYDRDQRTLYSINFGDSIPTGIRTKITVEHFRKVAEAASLFTRYLRDTHGGCTEADQSRMKSERQDNFDRSPLARMSTPSAQRPLRSQNRNNSNHHVSTRTGLPGSNYGIAPRYVNPETYKTLQFQNPPANSAFDTFEPTISEPSGRAPRIRQPAMTHGLNIQHPTYDAIAEHPIDDPRYQQPIRRLQSIKSPQQGRSHYSSTGEPYQPLEAHMTYEQQPESYIHQPVNGNAIETPRPMSISQQHGHVEYTRRGQVPVVQPYQGLDSRIGDTGNSEVTHGAHGYAMENY